MTKSVFIFLQVERLTLCLEAGLIRFLSADTLREHLFQVECFVSLAEDDFQDYSSFPLLLFSPFKNSIVSISF